MNLLKTCMAVLLGVVIGVLTMTFVRPQPVKAAVILSGATFYAFPAAQLGPPNTLRSKSEQDVQDHQTKEAHKNKKRRQDIRDDTERLFQLSSELKAAVETNGSLLSLDMVRKAQEAEKLAKELKKKMKDAIGPGPASEQNQLPSSPAFERPPL